MTVQPRVLVLLVLCLFTSQNCQAQREREEKTKKVATLLPSNTAPRSTEWIVEAIAVGVEIAIEVKSKFDQAKLVNADIYIINTALKIAWDDIDEELELYGYVPDRVLDYLESAEDEMQKAKKILESWWSKLAQFITTKYNQDAFARFRSAELLLNSVKKQLGISRRNEQIVSRETPSFVFVPANWRCRAKYYNNSDGCDCNCGTWDPDCNLNSTEVYNCDPGYVATCGQPDGSCIYANQSTPNGWICDASYYNTSDGCDCNCGAWDPDCNSSQQQIFNCYPASSVLCDVPTFQCKYPGVPVQWSCIPSFYNDSAFCDCGCGAYDPDCYSGVLPLSGCPCNSTTMYCNSIGFCEGSCNGYESKWVKMEPNGASYSSVAMFDLLVALCFSFLVSL